MQLIQRVMYGKIQCNLIFILITVIVLENVDAQIAQFTVGDYDYDNLQAEERPMPAELFAEIKNKTDVELAMEDCMNELVHCMSTSTYINNSKVSKVCAASPYIDKRHTFDNICLMFYEQCKGFGEWHFVYNGPCNADSSVPNPNTSPKRN